MKKIRRLHVFITGGVLFVIAALGSMFFLFKPQSEAIASKEKDYQTKKATADTVPQKETELVKAKADAKIAQLRLQSYSKRYRKIHFEKAAGDWDALFDLWHEYREQLGPTFIKFVESTGCRLTSGFSLPTPPASPVPLPASGFLSIPETGSFNVTVAGTLSQIFTLLKKFPSFEYLNVVGPVSVQGTSPRLTASFTISFYLVADASEKAKAAAPAPTQAPGGGAGPGGPGGMGGPGGIPGAPGGPGAKGPAGGPPAGAGKAAGGRAKGGGEEEGGGGLGRRRGRGGEGD